MAKTYSDYVAELVDKYKTYSSPTDAQKMIILLDAKSDMTTEEDKKLKILVNAERQHTRLNAARQKARDVLNADKNEKRKIETRKKIIWGSALKIAAIDNPEMAQMMVKLFDDGHISDRDKDAVLDDYNAFKIEDNNQPAY